MSHHGPLARLFLLLIDQIQQRTADPVFQDRSKTQTSALVRLLLLVLLADGDRDPAEKRLFAFLLAQIPRTWGDVGRIVEAEIAVVQTEPERLELARQSALSLGDRGLKRKAYEMTEMMFQATPTDAETYRRWHGVLAVALDIPIDQRESLAGKAASDYLFRIRRDIETIWSDLGEE